MPFRQSQPTEPKTPPALSPVERRAFRELAQELTARLRGPGARGRGRRRRSRAGRNAEARRPPAAPSDAAILEQTLLDRIPIGILLYRHDSLLYANRHFLEWSGYENRRRDRKVGRPEHAVRRPGAAALAENGGLQTFTIHNHGGTELPAEGRMFTVPWQGSSALALVLTNGEAEAALEKMQRALAAAESENRDGQIDPRHVADGIVTLDPQGLIADANARAAALFGLGPAGDFDRTLAG